MKRENNCWYWVTHPQEGDVWHPVFVDNEGKYVMAGNYEDKQALDQLVWEKAVMPELKEKAKQAIFFLLDQIYSVDGTAQLDTEACESLLKHDL